VASLELDIDLRELIFEFVAQRHEPVVDADAHAADHQDDSEDDRENKEYGNEASMARVIAGGYITSPRASPIENQMQVDVRRARHHERRDYIESHLVRVLGIPRNATS